MFPESKIMNYGKQNHSDKVKEIYLYVMPIYNGSYVLT